MTRPVKDHRLATNVSLDILLYAILDVVSVFLFQELFYTSQGVSCPLFGLELSAFCLKKPFYDHFAASHVCFCFFIERN